MEDINKLIEERNRMEEELSPVAPRSGDVRDVRDVNVLFDRVCNLEDEIKRADEALGLASQTIVELNEYLVDVLTQACTRESSVWGNVIDSWGVSAYADVMRYLEQKEILIIEEEFGDKIVARWIKTGG